MASSGNILCAAPGAHFDAGDAHAERRRARPAEGERDVAERDDARTAAETAASRGPASRSRGCTTSSAAGIIRATIRTASMTKATMRFDRMPSKSSGSRLRIVDETVRSPVRWSAVAHGVLLAVLSR